MQVKEGKERLFDNVTFTQEKGISPLSQCKYTTKKPIKPNTKAVFLEKPTQITQHYV